MPRKTTTVVRKLDSEKLAKKHKTPKGMKDVLWFGKYRGQRVSEIVRNDPQYVLWLHNNSPWAKFDNEVVQFATKRHSENQQRQKERRLAKSGFRKTKDGWVPPYSDPDVEDDDYLVEAWAREIAWE